MPRYKKVGWSLALPLMIVVIFVTSLAWDTFLSLSSIVYAFLTRLLGEEGPGGWIALGIGFLVALWIVIGLWHGSRDSDIGVDNTSDPGGIDGD